MPTCTVDNCSNVGYAKGYCKAHYARVRQHGDPLADKPLRIFRYDDPCEVEGCDRKVYGKGLCAAHYQRLRSHGDVQADKPLRKRDEPATGPCQVDGCDRKVVARQLCDAHYRRWRKGGDPGGPLRAMRAEVGDVRHAHSGYVEEYCPADDFTGRGGWQLQHRIVMARRLGRRLQPDELVHHKNGNKADNRDENLELWVRTHPNGQRVEDLLAFAREILARYEGIEDRL